MWRKHDDASKGEISVARIDQPRWISLGGGFDANGNLVTQGLHLVHDGQKILHLSEDTPDSHLKKVAIHQPAEDRILLPLFFEAHCHLFLKGATLDFAQRKIEQNLPPQTLLLNATQRAKALLQFGISKCRDGGDNAEVGLQLSKKGLSEGLAEVSSPGSGVNREKRYGSFFARSLEEHTTLEAIVEDRLHRGANHLKVVVTGIIDFEQGQVKGDPQFDTETLKFLVDQAHQKGLKVMAHASGEDGVRRAVLAGVDSIEHGFFMSRDILRLMAERQTLWVPTFAPVQVQVDKADLMGWSEISRKNLESILKHHRIMMLEAKELGVPVIPGSDAGSLGVPHGTGFLQELALMQDGGMTTQDLLGLACFSSHQLWYGRNINWGICAEANFQMARKEALLDVRSLMGERLVVIQGEAHHAGDGLHETF